MGSGGPFKIVDKLTVGSGTGKKHLRAPLLSATVADNKGLWPVQPTRNATECVEVLWDSPPSDGTGSPGRCTVHLMAIVNARARTVHASSHMPHMAIEPDNASLSTGFRAQKAFVSPWRCTAIACSQRRLATCTRTGRVAQWALMAAREGRRPGVMRPQEPRKSTCSAAAVAGGPGEKGRVCGGDQR